MNPAQIAQLLSAVHRASNGFDCAPPTLNRLKPYLLISARILPPLRPLLVAATPPTPYSPPSPLVSSISPPQIQLLPLTFSTHPPPSPLARRQEGMAMTEMRGGAAVVKPVLAAWPGGAGAAGGGRRRHHPRRWARRPRGAG